MGRSVGFLVVNVCVYQMCLVLANGVRPTVLLDKKWVVCSAMVQFAVLIAPYDVGVFKGAFVECIASTVKAVELPPKFWLVRARIMCLFNLWFP
ncbi:hypothetical protein M5M_06060 [Simiduia agarivorans SA1 = DSM 21679]|uniref:Uncharacterized protein n=1 Tax=Simiduia agarivorans (strain DSM 21679 / JCM 13881 / BCRC 17597 / SA1) TaxID=1117647 RepID=K4KH24_SIMAS|nr:hypothetical protein M5M_06060 [Simiduia agarivorans SA1 = DSM 21679]